MTNDQPPDALNGERERRRFEQALHEREERYRHLFNSIDEGFCTIEVMFDDAGRPVDYRFLETNASFVRQTGLADAVGRTMRELAPDHEQHWFDIYGRIARTGEPERFEQRADALGHWYDVYAFRVGEPEEHQVAILFNDIADRKRAEQALRESEERFRLIVENARYAAIFTMDADGFVSDWHEGAAKAFGYSAEEIVGQDGRILFTAADRAAREPDKEFETAAATGKADNVRWHVRKDGSPVFIDGVSTALHDANGKLTGFLKIGLDATDRQRAQEHQRTLLAELQHRVRNTLAVIRSIVRRTAASAVSVEEMEQHLDGRLGSFARTQTYVTRDPEGNIDLELIVREQLLAHASDGSRHISIKGPEVRLNAKQAETISLAVHELTTNAIKHGALTSDGNEVEVTWSIEGQSGARKLHFSWVERLRDRKLETPQRNGFGTELLERIMRYELDAEPKIAFTPTGLEYRVAIPLPATTSSH